MSHVIYRGTTVNNYFIDDMVDVHFMKICENENNKKYFARLSTYRKKGQPENEEGYPAMVLFSHEDRFKPLWAEPLEENWSKYLDSYGCVTEEFKKLLPEFFEKAINSIETK